VLNNHGAVLKALLLAEAYERALALIASKRDVVERIALVLVERQELSGSDLHRLVLDYEKKNMNTSR
jgi:ATP-dependent Zn protease